MLFSNIFTLLCLTLGATGATTRRRPTAERATSAATAAATTARSTRNSSRKSSTSNPTISAFVRAYTAGWKASVIDVSACETTLQLECDGANNDLCKADSGITVAATQKPGFYVLDYTTPGTRVIDACALTTSSQAVCTATVIANGTGTITDAPVTSTSVIYARIPVTAGEDRLRSAGASCTASSNAAVPTGVKGLVLYQLVAPLGAGVVAALAI
ncbi:uncharacterized protein CLAFUR5_00176 [Fulvia fulva]|uniref:Uncharacterized protein n=1 Tax=Passalora fulva TaxID=5499 RepID=A0A9Q8L7R9_PASFU|nr:uncharacterized protein CLAFUR5_00176 [Fulvia fulva]KAK4637599.1 hypothetical protein CLAFUR0_00176 [Fulvia fulva]UJO12423.1 hypothetical protein CLAFUR5_00176 [Fulvia fulva]WPV24154.1 hypothetical protein CLAFUW7_00178 [Fulvia fulva]